MHRVVGNPSECRPKHLGVCLSLDHEASISWCDRESRTRPQIQRQSEQTLLSASSPLTVLLLFVFAGPLMIFLTPGAIIYYQE